MRRLRSAVADSELYALRLSFVCGTGFFCCQLLLLQYYQVLSRMSTLVCGEGRTFELHRSVQNHLRYLGYSDVIAATIGFISLFIIYLGIARIIFQALWAQCVSWNIGRLYSQRQCTVERVPNHVLMLHYFSLTYVARSPLF